MYVTRYAINSWGVLYLQEIRGYSLIEAGGIISLNTFTGILGCVAFGFISDKYFKARRPPVTLMFGILEISNGQNIKFLQWNPIFRQKNSPII